MSKNMMKLTMGLLAVGCVLAMCGPAAADFIQKESNDFTWKYEMNVLPENADLDSQYGGDFTRLYGGTATTDGNILTADIPSDTSFAYSSGGATQTWQLDPDITYAKGYTYEVRIKVALNTSPLGLAFVAGPDDGAPSAWLNIAGGGQSWGSPPSSAAVGEQLDNTDAYHVFRVAQAPGLTVYSIWRDGKLLSDSVGAGYGATATPEINFGDYGMEWGGIFEIDYLRFTGGAYAPIPEPGTLALLATGLIGLLCYAWRKRR